MGPPRKKPTAAKHSPAMGEREPEDTASTNTEPALAADEPFDRFPRQTMALLGWFFLEHLNDLYRAFNGDMVMPIILGEIAHHNICHHYSQGRQKRALDDIDPMVATKWDSLEPCNALSLSDATGIPRETCRRKVRELCQRGFIRRKSHGGYAINRGVSQRFLELNRRTLARYLVLVRDLAALTSAAGR